MNAPVPSYIKKTLQFPAELVEFCGLIRELRPHSYLEIGCKFGGSLWSVAHAMARESRIVAVDLPQTAETQASLTRCCHDLIAAGYDVHLIIGDSSRPTVVEKIKALAPFDLILIDANHTEAFVRADFKNYGALGKTICFHDIAWNNPTKPGHLPIEVPKVWRELKETYKDKAQFREIKRDVGHNGFGIMTWHPT